MEQICYTEIPELKNILEHYAHIKPMVFKGGKKYYLRKLLNFGLFYFSYVTINDPSYYDKPVNLNELSYLADVKIVHKYKNCEVFEPTIAEVIQQIPEDLLPLTASFEMIYIPVNFTDFEVFRKEFALGYHVSIVRLYQKRTKNSSDKCKRIDIPRNMTAREYEDFTSKIILQKIS